MSVMWIKRLYHWGKWPRIVGWGAIVAIIVTLPLARPMFYEPQYDQNINYWLLILRGDFLIMIFILLFRFMTFFGFVLFLKNGKLVLTLILAAGVFTCYSCVQNLFSDGTRLRHVSSVDFNGHTYHLTQSDTVSGGWDAFETTFILYECDPPGILCHVRHIAYPPDSVNYNQSFEVALELDPAIKQLQLQIGGETVYTIQADEASNDVQ